MTKTQKGILAVILIAVIFAGVWQWPGITASFKGDGVPQISEQAKAHILYGDKRGGGHKFGAGKICKTEFPKSWDEDAIIANIQKVAANDNLKWKKQKNGYYVAAEKIDGVRVRVVLDKERDDIVTAYPIHTKRSNCPVKVSAKTKQSPDAATAANKMPAAGNDNEIVTND